MVAGIVMCIVFFAIRCKINQLLRPIGRPRFNSLFCGKGNPRVPLKKDRAAAKRAPIYHIIIYTVFFGFSLAELLRNEMMFLVYVDIIWYAVSILIFYKIRTEFDEYYVYAL